MANNRTLDRRSAGTARTFGRAALVASTLVVLEVLSMLLVPSVGAAPVGAHRLPVTTFAARSSSPAADQLALASQSLERGAGPARGAALSCSSGAPSSLTCAASPTSPPHQRALISSGPTWNRLIVPNPTALDVATMVFDVRDGYVVLFGGVTANSVILNQTWKFTPATGWTLLHPARSPGARGEAAMAFDTKDNYVLLYGGGNATSFFTDTWDFAGGVWTLLAPAIHPGVLLFASMANDAKDGYVVLFGGLNATSVSQSTTWKFAAGVWTKLTLATHPAARFAAYFAYDAHDSYDLLFGGANSTVFADTWKFTGGAWTKLTPATHPSARYVGGMAYSAKDGKLVLFGGNTLSVTVSDTWSYAGGVWSKLGTYVHPSNRDLFGMADGTATQNITLFGGYSGGTPLYNDTWSFHGTVWNHVIKLVPGSRYYACLTFDEADGYVLLFGGAVAGSIVGDTWKFAGGNWIQLHPATAPSDRYAAGMTYDQADGYVLLYGGFNMTAFAMNDTWSFLAGKWSLITTSSGPGGRGYLSMTYDAADGYVLMFGGENGPSLLGDTWGYQAGVWTLLQSPSPYSPSPRILSQMTYDSEDGVVVLFSGDTAIGTIADTWTFSAGGWTNLTSSLSTSPAPTAASGMADDTYDGYVVLYGPGVSNQTWSFSGGAWTQLNPKTNVGVDDYEQMTFDPSLNAVLLFGGYRYGTWTY